LEYREVSPQHVSNASQTFDPVRRRIRRIIVVVLGGAVLSVSLPLTVWRLLLEWDIEDHLRRLEVAAYPMSSNQVRAWHRDLTDEENGAALFLNAAETLNLSVVDPAWRAVDSLNKSETNGLPAGLREELGCWLDLHREVLNALHAAAAQKSGRYHLDFATQGDFQKLTALKAAAYLLAGEALDFAEQRQFDCAAESIEAIYRLGESLVDEPFVAPQMVRYAIESVGFTALRNVMDQGEFSSGQSRLFMNFLQTIDTSDGLVRALAGERGWTIDQIRAGPDLDYTNDPAWVRWVAAEVDPHIRKVIHASGFFERDLRFFLTAMETNIALAQLPPPASLQAAYSMREQSKVAADWIQLGSALTLFPLQHMPVRDARHRAQLRLARTALAVEMFRRDHQGKRPDCLGQLAPAYLLTIPQDPFDGKELRYQVHAAGYSVYSVSIDGIDDGGKDIRSGQSDRRARRFYDVVLRVDR
jgi:hypothetical protein